jgi:hypothetical protein
LAKILSPTHKPGIEALPLTSASTFGVSWFYLLLWKFSPAEKPEIGKC